MSLEVLMWTELAMKAAIYIREKHRFSLFTQNANKFPKIIIRFFTITL